MHTLLADTDTFMLNGEYKGARGIEAIDLIQEKATAKLVSSLRSRKLYGFPINTSFTDVDSIMSRVKGTSIHESNHPDVQFIASVRVIPYVNNILSVWIFLGTMETMNGTNAVGAMTSMMSPSGGSPSSRARSRRRMSQIS